MVSTFKAVNAQGYQQIMGRFSTRLATSFLSYIGQESGQAGRVPVISRLGLDL